MGHRSLIPTRTTVKALAAGALLTTLLGCQSAYYGAMEKVGVHKRDIMVDRIESVTEAQTEGQEQFSSALEQFSSIVKVGPSELQSVYDGLSDEYEDSAEAAAEISERIDAVENVSEALFSEWEEELELYGSASLRADSRRKLSATKAKYTKLMASMRRSEASVKPVLSAMHDQVLYLKHNLNANAISALKGEAAAIKSDVEVLNRRMQDSIKESQSFINHLQSS
ncbi:DUF2959 family protein [Sinobacterium caligoides]|uniref:DUF2959 family protein n=1 Tax=Sinobacterium caligoides TaxID=933926 RepID=A0A3N2DNQ4_9GAMM|nr:DUF2959 domain-containing protein [Sinobacterium caligoides]ROS01441.1 DUF2959 family protein [Sinobacterium caligoides]